MEQKRQEVIESLRRILISAAGEKTYTMPAGEAIDVATAALELLESAEPMERAFIPEKKSRITIEERTEKTIYETSGFCFIALDDENIGGINCLRRVRGDNAKNLLLYTGLRKQVEMLEKEDKMLAALYEIANGLDGVQEMRHDVKKS